MKLRSILCGVLAIAAAVACKPDDVVETPKLDVDKTAVSVAAEAGQATFNVTTNQDWTASADADWVSVNPNNGKASDKAVAVKVTAEDNATEAERTATVTVKAGTLSKTVKVTQAAKTTTPEPPVDEPEYTLDGKQWITEVDGMPVLFDFGITEEEMLCVAIPLMDGSGFGLYMAGLYEIVPADATSGVVVYTSYDWEWEEFGDPVEIPYSDLNATSVKAVCEAVFGVTDPITLTLVENPYEIVIDGGNGGGPSGPVEDGDYWFFNSGKVMAPLAEGTMSGALPAEDAVDGASTAKNIFTLTYDPDWSYYTIQDSYGRYLGQTDETGNITVTDVLPTDDTYAFYLWCVETGYGEACSIYNASYYYDITYSAANNNWVLVDGGYEYPETLPVLVKAENPVEEPVEPEGPKVVTVAEFLAGPDDETIEYQVSGEITGIYQSYSSQYGNISIYITDETASMLAFRLSCEGIEDPANTITVGDLITVKGYRTLYNSAPQMAAGGVIVEHTDVVIEGPEAPEGTTEASVVFKDNGYANAYVVDNEKIYLDDAVYCKFTQGSASNPPAYYTSGEAIRMYQNGAKLEVSAPGKTIVAIEFTFASNMWYLGTSQGEFSEEGAIRTWTGEAETVNFVSTGTDKNHRAYVSAMKVYYK